MMIISLNSINQLVFKMEAVCFRDVEAEFLYTIYKNFLFQRIKLNRKCDIYFHRSDDESSNHL
jgi:hypothetical protein